MIATEIGTIPVAMEALVGLATLLLTGEQKDRERALELLGFVLSHSASTYETKDKSLRLIKEFDTESQEQAVDAARKSRQEKTLEAFVEDILGNAP